MLGYGIWSEWHEATPDCCGWGRSIEPETCRVLDALLAEKQAHKEEEEAKLAACGALSEALDMLEAEKRRADELDEAVSQLCDERDWYHDKLSAERQAREKAEREAEQYFNELNGIPGDFKGEVCQLCGKPYSAIYSVPDSVWNQIKPSGKPEGGGLLCPACAMRRCEQLGISLWWEAEENDFPTSSYAEEVGSTTLQLLKAEAVIRWYADTKTLARDYTLFETDAAALTEIAREYFEEKKG